MKIFQTIGEVVEDPIFKQKVDEVLTEEVKKWRNRPDPKPGYKYVRNWMDRLQSEGALKTDFLMGHIGAIWAKVSPLPVQLRIGIQDVCDEAFRRTQTTYAKLEKETKIEPCGPVEQTPAAEA